MRTIERAATAAEVTTLVMAAGRGPFSENRRSMGIWRSVISLLALGILLYGVHAAESPPDLKNLFDAYAGKHDEQAGDKIVALKDEAVPFLSGVILAREPHPRKFVTVDGPQQVMGTWSQEAATLLYRINTTLAVAEARKLATHDEREVRFWGIWVLKTCKNDRENNIAFLRSRVEAETGRNRSDILELLGEQRDPKDLPLFKKLVEGERDKHVRLALLYAMAQQGDKEALLEIVKVCEAGSGHLGVVYLQRVTGKDFGWEMNLWREWLEKISPEDLKRTIDRKARPKEVREGGWDKFLAAVTCLQEEGDRAKAAGIFQEVVANFPRSDYAEDSKELAGFLEKMAVEDRAWKEPADPGKLGLEEKIRYLVHHLRDVECYQQSQPGVCDILSGCGRTGDRPNPAVELSKLGEAAVPALLDLLEDRRPTRSVGYWRDFGKSRTVLRYQDVAVRILDELTGAPFYTRQTTRSYFSIEEPEDRHAIIEALRAWFREGKGKSPAERKWLVYRKADFYPAGLSLLRSIAKDDGKQEEVLAELRQMYPKAHWVYRPLIAELMADLGDQAKVAEVLASRPEYAKRMPGTPRLSLAHSAGENALGRLSGKYRKSEQDGGTER